MFRLGKFHTFSTCCSRSSHGFWTLCRRAPCVRSQCPYALRQSTETSGRTSSVPREKWTPNSPRESSSQFSEPSIAKSSLPSMGSCTIYISMTCLVNPLQKQPTTNNQQPQPTSINNSTSRLPARVPILSCVTSGNSFTLLTMDVDSATGAARRRQRRLRQFLRRQRLSVAMALAEYSHHTAPRGLRMARAGGVERAPSQTGCSPCLDCRSGFCATPWSSSPSVCWSFRCWTLMCRRWLTSWLMS